MTVTMWQTTSLDEAIAAEFFGWKWKAFDSPRYPADHPARVVRQLLSPEQQRAMTWIKFLEEQNGHPSDETEPRERDPWRAIQPHFSGHWDAIHDLEVELRNRQLWTKYRDQLWQQIGGGEGAIDEEALADAGCEQRCIAALAVIGSKHAVGGQQC